MTTRLVYVRSQAASDCPGQSALEDAVAARLGYEAFSPWGDQTIIATISPDHGGLLARAELIDHDGVAQGSRQVRVRRSDCKELIATLALAISITLDRTLVAATSSESPQVDEQSVSAPPANDSRVSEQRSERTAPSAPTDQPATEQPEPPRAVLANETAAQQTRPRQPTAAALYAQAGAFGAFALVPAATLGVRIGAGLSRGPFSGWLAGMATFPRAETATQYSEVRIKLLSSELALCGELLRPFSLCSLTLLGAMRGEGVGVSAPKKESSFYASAGARGLFFLPLGSAFALLGNADLSAVLTRPTFQLEGVDVWRPAALAFAAGLGLTGRFL
ncbi:MAG TPA: hypothetical protein VFK05_33485 [Polyangiaceae bacterium]|nr:hypothetical protein [Polyangiaceae bacterium]